VGQIGQWGQATEISQHGPPGEVVDGVGCGKAPTPPTSSPVPWLQQLALASFQCNIPAPSSPRRCRRAPHACCAHTTATGTLLCPSKQSPGAQPRPSTPVPVRHMCAARSAGATLCDDKSDVRTRSLTARTANGCCRSSATSTAGDKGSSRCCASRIKSNISCETRCCPAARAVIFPLTGLIEYTLSSFPCAPSPCAWLPFSSTSVGTVSSPLAPSTSSAQVNACQRASMARERASRTSHGRTHSATISCTSPFAALLKLPRIGVLDRKSLAISRSLAFENGATKYSVMPKAPCDCGGAAVLDAGILKSPDALVNPNAGTDLSLAGADPFEGRISSERQGPPSDDPPRSPKGSARKSHTERAMPSRGPVSTLAWMWERGLVVRAKRRSPRNLACFHVSGGGGIFESTPLLREPCRARGEEV